MTVNNVNALLAYAGRPDAAVSAPDESAGGSFEQIMTKVNGKTDTVQTSVSNGNSPASQTVVPAVNTVKKDVAVDKTGTQNANKAEQKTDTVRKDQDGNVAQDARTDSKTDTKTAAAEEVEKSAKELVEDIADEMDVTPEEVEKAMELLGLTAIQLFDTDNLRQLLLAISGNGDELSLLTDETLYGNLQDLLGTVEESLADLQEELGLSDEEMEALMKQLLAEQGEADDMNAGKPVTDLEGMKDYTVSVQKDGETVQMKVTVDDESGNRSVQESVTGTSVKEVQDSQKMQERDASAGNGRDGREGHTAGQAMMQAQTPVEMAESPEAAPVEYRSQQTEEIMNQIVEYMKINVKADTQTMELQLHPASLGTVNVQIMAKEGGLTAHFTTQNETVRAVIETQLIQLKNQFEEQGIKVNAVEVTVANHAYGEQFSQDSENTRQDQSKASKGRRRINLDQFGDDEELEEMEESERIAVEMMQANGGTVDYMA